MSKVRTEEELQEAAKREEAKIILYGSLAEPIVKIKMADRLSRIFCITGLAIAAILLLGAGKPGIIFAAAVALLSFGILAAGFIISAAVLKKTGENRRSFEVLRRKYKIADRREDKVFLRKT
jgi:hypothetical protein